MEHIVIYLDTRSLGKGNEAKDLGSMFLAKSRVVGDHNCCDRVSFIHLFRHDPPFTNPHSFNQKLVVSVRAVSARKVKAALPCHCSHRGLLETKLNSSQLYPRCKYCIVVKRKRIKKELTPHPFLL